VKLTTWLVLGTAGTATYLFMKNKSGSQPDQSGGDETVLADHAEHARQPTLVQKVKQTITRQHRRGPRGQVAGIPKEVRADTSATNDLALARNVEAALTANPHFPRGRVIVSADAGRITLRGTTDLGEHIPEFEAGARAVPGVKDVENLLHVQGTPAPAR
jgi:hypothetical protein